jgi:hypothetical protein
MMYCPKCATQNNTDVKFCRSCGTEIEAVALALSGKSLKADKAGKDKIELKTTEDWLEKHAEGVSGMTRGIILMIVSLLIGFALAEFLPATFEAPWILIWTVFFGWMAVWGGIELAYGISYVIESKSRIRLLRLKAKELRIEGASQLLPSADERPRIVDSTFKTPAPASVTEGTTRHLEDLIEK